MGWEWMGWGGGVNNVFMLYCEHLLTRQIDHDSCKSQTGNFSDPVGPRKKREIDHGSEKSKSILCATSRARRPALEGAKPSSGPKKP